MKAEHHISFTMPKYSKWKCYMTSEFCVVPLEGKEPCWFHRKMQKLILGFEWRKDEIQS